MVIKIGPFTLGSPPGKHRFPEKKSARWLNRNDANLAEFEALKEEAKGWRTLERRLEDEQSRSQILERDYSHLETHYGQLNEEYSRLKTDYDELLSTGSTAQNDEIARLTEAKSGLETRLSEFRGSMVSLQNEVAFGKFCVQLVQANDRYVPPSVAPFKEYYSTKRIGIIEPPREDGGTYPYALHLNRNFIGRLGLTILPVVPQDGVQNFYDFVVCYGDLDSIEAARKSNRIENYSLISSNFQEHGLRALWDQFRAATLNR